MCHQSFDLECKRLIKLQHGNRSPLADPRMKGMITGLTLDDSLNDLARKFNVTLEVSMCHPSYCRIVKLTFQSIALQTRHIVDEMNSRGHQINSIYMSGQSYFTTFPYHGRPTLPLNL